MQKFDNFTNIPFTIDNLDRYFIRTSIFNALKHYLIFFKGRLLDVGCGKMPYKNYILQNSNVSEYVGLDIETAIEYDENVKPDFTWDGNVIPFESDSYDTIMATEVLEHCPFPSQILGEMYRVLKKDGSIFLTVPFLWNLHETPHDEYRYTPFALHRLLSEAGFVNIEINASGGWHASMAQMLGLWVRRSGLSRALKLFLSILLKPVIKCLIKKDRIPATFHEGAMIVGLYATATKQF